MFMDLEEASPDFANFKGFFEDVTVKAVLYLLVCTCSCLTEKTNLNASNDSSNPIEAST